MAAPLEHVVIDSGLRVIGNLKVHGTIQGEQVVSSAGGSEFLSVVRPLANVDGPRQITFDFHKSNRLVVMNVSYASDSKTAPAEYISFANVIPVNMRPSAGSFTAPIWRLDAATTVLATVLADGNVWISASSMDPQAVFAVGAAVSWRQFSLSWTV